MSLLLEILEETDFYVRFDTVQLLNTLLANTNSLQDCILASPMGISRFDFFVILMIRLIDLLEDKREIIRNEGLLLLISLTKSNAEIQKIVAFENAFEKLLGIIIEEGAADGGIIVQDCLQLIHNLLRYNISNQVCHSNRAQVDRISLEKRAVYIKYDLSLALYQMTTTCGFPKKLQTRLPFWNWCGFLLAQRIPTRP